MPALLVVPLSLSNELYRRVDAAIADVPDAAKDRESIYRQLLQYFNENGVIPDFSLAKIEVSDDVVGEARP